MGFALARPRAYLSGMSDADATDSRKLPGTGLGLAITRELCQQLGGQVGYRDADGGGAEFYIQLPVIES